MFICATLQCPKKYLNITVNWIAILQNHYNEKCCFKLNCQIPKYINSIFSAVTFVAISYHSGQLNPFSNRQWIWLDMCDSSSLATLSDQIKIQQNDLQETGRLFGEYEQFCLFCWWKMLWMFCWYHHTIHHIEITPSMKNKPSASRNPHLGPFTGTA